MKKKCVQCGKQIPSVAHNCVFCSSRQPAPDFSDIDVLRDAVDTAKRKSEQMAALSSTEGLFDDEPGSQTEHTLVGLRIADLGVTEEEIRGVIGGGPAKETNGSASAQLKHTALVPVVETPKPEPKPIVQPLPKEEPTPVEVPRRVAWTARPWEALGRAVMGVGGGFMILLFLLPWHGASSWQLLETLSGADFVRQLFYLAGGLVLLTSALLPLPFLFRAAVGASVAALPVLLGARGVLDGWRGVDRKSVV